MKIFFLVTVLALIGVSCGNSHSKTEEAPKEKSFFPIAEYVKGEIRIIDSLPVGIMKKLIRGKSRDSSYIERSEFHELAKEFAGPELTKSQMEENYNEHSFMDETTGSYTFTYEPAKQGTLFHRIDVLAIPGQTTDKIKSIYLERSYLQNDTTINERLYWKANISFSIIKEKVYKDQSPIVEQLLVIWDPSAY